jgi:co-chaperonin GroES (HSP10)
MSDKSSTLTVVGRARRVRCKLCLDSRIMEVDTWDDRVEPEFTHDCRARGPRLSKPVTRDGFPVPFFPVGKRILVQCLPEEDRVGNIIIPETSRGRQVYGTLICAGPQAQGILDDMGFVIGDTLSFGKYSGVVYTWYVEVDGRKETREVMQFMIDDIFGGKELAEKMMDGRLGIELHEYAPGQKEYRFMEYVGPVETEDRKEKEDGETV